MIATSAPDPRIEIRGELAESRDEIERLRAALTDIFDLPTNVHPEDLVPEMLRIADEALRPEQ